MFSVLSHKDQEHWPGLKDSLPRSDLPHSVSFSNLFITFQPQGLFFQLFESARLLRALMKSSWNITPHLLLTNSYSSLRPQCKCHLLRMSQTGPVSLTWIFTSSYTWVSSRNHNCNCASSYLFSALAPRSKLQEFRGHIVLAHCFNIFAQKSVWDKVLKLL